MKNIETRLAIRALLIFTILMWTMIAAARITPGKPAATFPLTPGDQVDQTAFNCLTIYPYYYPYAYEVEAYIICSASLVCGSWKHLRFEVENEQVLWVAYDPVGEMNTGSLMAGLNGQLTPPTAEGRNWHAQRDIVVAKGNSWFSEVTYVILWEQR
jgi:hypothetical protein